MLHWSGRVARELVCGKHDGICMPSKMIERTRFSARSEVFIAAVLFNIESRHLHAIHCEANLYLSAVFE